jgi:hypothetical protein
MGPLKAGYFMAQAGKPVPPGFFAARAKFIKGGLPQDQENPPQIDTNRRSQLFRKELL